MTDKENAYQALIDKRKSFAFKDKELTNPRVPVTMGRMWSLGLSGKVISMRGSWSLARNPVIRTRLSKLVERWSDMRASMNIRRTRTLLNTWHLLAWIPDIHYHPTRETGCSSSML